MDDIFQILIYIFIIVTFLASLFKKKTQQDKRTEPAKPVPQPGMETKPPQQQEEYDILKEIERMFKTDLPVPEKEKTYREEEIESEHMKTDKWHQPVETEHKTAVSEHSYEMWEDKRRKADEKRKAINERTIQKAADFEKHLAKTAGEKSKIRENLIQKFKEPASLKEYIIFSEIIGKPKALQE